MNNKKKALTIIIRASGEATLPLLKKQIKKQLYKDDILKVIDNDDSFELKLAQGFKEAINLNNSTAIFIDADILIRRNLLNKIRKLSLKLKEDDLGFGIKLWDRFYDQPKFRGLHIYKTKHLKIALSHIPKEGISLRPESAMKNELSGFGLSWNNQMTHYIGGLHDFSQYLSDIHYKFLVRSNRASKEELSELKCLFKRSSDNNEFKVAYDAILNGKNKKIKNDKKIYRNEFQSSLKSHKGYIPRNIESYLISKTFKRYSLTKRFLNSNFL